MGADDLRGVAVTAARRVRLASTASVRSLERTRRLLPRETRRQSDGRVDGVAAARPRGDAIDAMAYGLQSGRVDGAAATIAA